HAHGSVNLGGHTSSTQKIVEAVMQLYDRIADPALLVRRLNVTANNIMLEEEAEKPVRYEQMDLFTDYEALERQKEVEREKKEKEKSLQKAVIGIKKRYGKNAILKGTDLQEGATMIERNSQIGGHKS
ncbi:MAG: DNA methylase, partial [Schwartzia sp.]|nr:DNA methylase [Schwartzia sp. (in: firmicutes)]